MSFDIKSGAQNFDFTLFLRGLYLKYFPILLYYCYINVLMIRNKLGDINTLFNRFMLNQDTVLLFVNEHNLKHYVFKKKNIKVLMKPHQDLIQSFYIQS